MQNDLPDVGQLSLASSTPVDFPFTDYFQKQLLSHSFTDFCPPTESITSRNKMS